MLKPIRECLLTVATGFDHFQDVNDGVEPTLAFLDMFPDAFMCAQVQNSAEQHGAAKMYLSCGS